MTVTYADRHLLSKAKGALRSLIMLQFLIYNFDFAIINPVSTHGRHLKKQCSSTIYAK